MADNPTNGELAIMLENLSKRSDERHDETKSILSEMKETSSQTLKQAQATNGRVNKHDWYFKIAWWGLGAISSVLLIGVPIAYNLLTYYIDVKTKEVEVRNNENIKKAIVEALDEKVSKAQYEE